MVRVAMPMESFRLEMRSLAWDLLDGLEDEGASLTPLLGKTKRLTVLMDDEVNDLWLTLELQGCVPLPERIQGRRNQPNTKVAFSKFVRTRGYREITVQDIDDVGDGRLEIGQLVGRPREKILSVALSILEALGPEPSPPSALSPLLHDAHVKQVLYRQEVKQILARIRREAHEYVLSVYRALRFAAFEDSVFEKYRAVVDGKLAAICPEALEKIAAAYERLPGKSEEERSQAALECRRLLYSFANVVYPARSGKINGHVVDDQSWVNRLRAFLDANATAGGSSLDLTRGTLERLGTQLDHLNSLSSKGVHSRISEDDAVRVFVHSYIVLGDIIMLCGLGQ